MTYNTVGLSYVSCTETRILASVRVLRVMAVRLCGHLFPLHSILINS